MINLQLQILSLAFSHLYKGMNFDMMILQISSENTLSCVDLMVSHHIMSVVYLCNSWYWMLSFTASQCLAIQAFISVGSVKFNYANKKYNKKKFFMYQFQLKFIHIWIIFAFLFCVIKNYPQCANQPTWPLHWTMYAKK